MGDFEQNIDIEYLKKAAIQVEAVKELTYRLIHDANPERILDVGCGPGLDTVTLVQRLPHAREIIGLDSDGKMVEAANRLSQKQGCAGLVHHMQGSALTMPFGDGYFDVVRAERLFQVIPASVASPEAILQEMLRVLKSDALLVLADTDWAAASVEFSEPDLERRIIRFFAEKCRPNGYAGRQIYALVKSAGLADVHIESIPVYTFTFEPENPLGNWMVEEARKRGAIGEPELSLWMEELLTRSKEGRFLAVTNMNIVWGRKP